MQAHSRAFLQSQKAASVLQLSFGHIEARSLLEKIITRVAQYSFAAYSLSWHHVVRPLLVYSPATVLSYHDSHASTLLLAYQCNFWPSSNSMRSDKDSTVIAIPHQLHRPQQPRPTFLHKSGETISSLGSSLYSTDAFFGRYAAKFRKPLQGSRIPNHQRSATSDFSLLKLY
jgi:hypothetical protein